MASKGNAEKGPDRPALFLEQGRNFFRGEGRLWLPVTEWELSKYFHLDCEKLIYYCKLFKVLKGKEE